MGRAGRDGELRMMRGGVALGIVSIATNRFVRQQGGDYEEVADWHRIKAFGPLGRRLAAVRKGERLFVEAELRYSRWTDKERVVRYQTDIIARTIVNIGDAGVAVPEYEPRGEEPPLPEEG